MTAKQIIGPNPDASTIFLQGFIFVHKTLNYFF